MSTQYDQMIDLLKERGFRMTNARKHIVAMFDTDCEPMSALDVQRRLKKKPKEKLLKLKVMMN
jgi:Fe2+ or Zn2+ uptake regulation protein